MDTHEQAPKNIVVGHRFGLALDKEFVPPGDPYRRPQTIGRLMLAAIEQGEPLPPTSRRDGTLRVGFEPEWADSVRAVALYALTAKEGPTGRELEASASGLMLENTASGEELLFRHVMYDQEYVEVVEGNSYWQLPLMREADRLEARMSVATVALGFFDRAHHESA